MKRAIQVRSDWEVALSEFVEHFLRPVVRLLLRLGMGASEFSAIAKSVFVQVASEEYGIRGRPTNTSRIAAMTGLSRKEVARVRSGQQIVEWTPRQVTTPLNEVLHYWHTDPDFVDASGEPRVLPMEGVSGFEGLVARYGGDIPAGAMRRELENREAIAIVEDAFVVKKRFVHRAAVDSDFIRNLAFSLEGLCTTLAHNADLVERIRAGSSDTHESHGRFERIAWTSYMTSEEIERFRMWVRREGSRFLEEADTRIGEGELPKESRDQAEGRTTGVGVFFFDIGAPEPNWERES